MNNSDRCRELYELWGGVAMSVTVTCPYCNSAARLVTGAVIYPHRSDLHKKRFYLCAPCQAWVGCHPGTERPLGRLADEQLRAARVRAHAYFDQLWQSGQMKRKDAYAWLAEQLGIEVKKCHISWFDVQQCERVVEACQNIPISSD